MLVSYGHVNPQELWSRRVAVFIDSTFRACRVSKEHIIALGESPPAKLVLNDWLPDVVELHKVKSTVADSKNLLSDILCGDLTLRLASNLSSNKGSHVCDTRLTTGLMNQRTDNVLIAADLR